jgi:hypothetical protein
VPGAAIETVPIPATEPGPIGATQPATPGENGSPRPAATAGVRDLFARLHVRREPASGKVVIEAPAEVAGELGALFEGMAALLQSLGRAGDDASGQ